MRRKKNIKSDFIGRCGVVLHADERVGVLAALNADIVLQMDDMAAARILLDILGGIEAGILDPAAVDLGFESAGRDSRIQEIEAVLTGNGHKLEIMVVIEQGDAGSLAQLAELVDVADSLGELGAAGTLVFAQERHGDIGAADSLVIGDGAEHIGDDGYPWTEQIPNVLTLAAGEMELTEEALQILNSLPVASSEDNVFKESWTISAVQAYLQALGAHEDIKPVLTQLITNESEWGNIEGMIQPETEEIEQNPSDTESPEKETLPETDVPAEEEPYNPWEDTGGGNSIDSIEGESSKETSEEEQPEEEIARIWLSEPYEPEDPILETDYTMNDFENIHELLEAISYFKAVTVPYPGKYILATEENSAYFDPDLQKGLTTFQQYRKYK